MVQKRKWPVLKEIRDVDELKRKALTVGFYGAAGFLGWRFVVQPTLQKMRRNREQSDMINDPNKRQATVLHNAMNPSGVSWMRSMDRTDEKMVYEAARNITDWNAVQTTYRNLYNRDLLSDLQGELDSKEYQTFLRILGQGKPSRTKSGASGFEKGTIIASKKNVRLRSTPDSSKGPLSLNTNILTTIPAGKFLGWATGTQEVDNNGVRYIQVAIRFTEGIPKGVFYQMYRKLGTKTITFWVGAGAIHQFRYYQKMLGAGIKLYKGAKDMGLRKDFK